MAQPIDVPLLSPSTFYTRNLKVLIVDDDEVDRMSVRRAFKGAEFLAELVEAEDCAMALNVVNQHKFDCIFIDYLLPDGNGLDLVRALREQGVQVPLVCLTGQSNDQIAVELMKAGASDYLSKTNVSPGRLRQVFQNVLRVYHAEVAAAIANQQREELLQQKEEFITRLTHDLQTPLIAANRMLQLIQEDAFGPIPAVVNQHVGVIIRSNENLLQMVNNIVSVYTYDSEAKRLNLIPVPMVELAEDVRQELTPLASLKHLTLTIELLNSEPPGSFVVLGDRLDLKRLLTNLVGNSLKFTDAGGVTLRLTAATQAEPSVLIQVIDTGNGIPLADQANLFERFRRGQHKRSNSGLGLYLCRQIAAAHGGTISVKSALGEGCIMTVKLPIADNPPPPPD